MVNRRICAFVKEDVSLLAASSRMRSACVTSAEFLPVGLMSSSAAVASMLASEKLLSWCFLKGLISRRRAKCQEV